MRRGLIIIFVLLIVAVGAVVVYVVIHQLQSQTTQQAVTTNVDVYVAGQNIPQGGKITSDVLSTKTLPQTMVTADMYTTAEKSDLLNNKIASYPLVRARLLREGKSLMHRSPWQFRTFVGNGDPPGMVAKSSRRHAFP